MDVNASTPFGRTPMHAAAARDHLTVLDLLLKYAASIRQTDCYGMTAHDVAKEMLSELCAKRLRVMLLNLRGMIGQKTSRDNRSRSGIPHGKHTLRESLLEMPSRSNTVTDMRAHSTVSQNSEENRDVNTSHNIKRNKRKTPLNASLADNSSVNNTKTDIVYTPSTVLKNQGDSKRLIKWKDAPTGNTYWQVIEIGQDESRNISKAMDIKPIALLQQTKVLKFDRNTKEPTVPPGSPVSSISRTEGTSMMTPRESIFSKYSSGRSISPKSVRFSKVR